MERLFTLKIPGAPVGKARPKFRRRGKFVQTYTPTEWWEKAVVKMIQSYWRKKPFAGPLALYIRAVKKRPKAMYARKYREGRLFRTTMPDGDNVIKIVADALQKAKVVTNDKEISRWFADNLYGGRNEPPAVYVRLYRLSQRDLRF